MSDLDSARARPEFPTTRWSLVIAAAEASSPNSQHALTYLCETYWYPLYAYARRRGWSDVDSQDLTQEFFSCLLEKDYVAAADADRGRFRSFLLTCFKHFLSHQRDQRRAQKRGGGQPQFSLDFSPGDSRYQSGPAETLTPETLYEREWVVSVLDLVMQRLADEMQSANKADHFTILKPFMIGDGNSCGYAAAAKDLDTSETAARMAAHRMRKRYRTLLREEIMQTIAHVADVDDEIDRLFAVFSG